eukprot:TRINITY_DN13300_c0_g1_i1.p2 TRINITY_DN13300_c0_g1~~TRINITY_DN13300_c0_g1_i1.p2  ORF type:complete len:161 (-),score=11.79 TRINITY_DN13300_c0_g1_i1:205-687(-)
MGGMDDARDLQPFKEDDDGFQARKLPVYLSRATFNVFRASFPYIVEASEAVGPIRRRVAQLDFRFLDDDPNAPVQDVEVAGLQIAVLPVYHGGEYVSFGFAFGTTHRVLYLSDVSQVPRRSRPTSTARSSTSSSWTACTPRAGSTSATSASTTRWPSPSR